MSPGDIVTYTLPEITDPDNDSFNVNILLQQTIPFAITANNSIKFSPADKDANLALYIIKIVLTDNNPFPKSNEYFLSVTVSPITPLVNKTIHIIPHKISQSKVMYNLTMKQYSSLQNL